MLMILFGNKEDYTVFESDFNRNLEILNNIFILNKLSLTAEKRDDIKKRRCGFNLY